MDLGFHFQNQKHFLKYLGFCLLATAYEKTILGIFVCLFICEVTTTKVNFDFYKQCIQDAIHFLTKCYYRFLALIFLCTLKKNTAEKLCKTLEMELKSHTPAGPDFFLRKSNLKFCFIFDMILLANAQGLVNFRLACS